MSDRPLIEVAIRHRIGPLALDVAFSLTEPWTALFGPSGAGKSTILRAIAGLVRPDDGRIALRQNATTVLCDTRDGTFLPAHLRGVRYMAQGAALFPHRSVVENVRFGVRRGGPVEEVLEMCRVRHLAGMMPGTLSGGERQRVTLARVLAALPARLVLLDEPFAGLDGELRDAVMGDVRRWLGEKGVPVLHVTHDVGEVFAMGADVLRIDAGSITGYGPADAVLGPDRERLRAQLGV